MNIQEFLDQDYLTLNKVSDYELVELFKSVPDNHAKFFIDTVDRFIKNWEIPKEINDLREAVHFLNLEFYLYKEWLIWKWHNKN